MKTYALTRSSRWPRFAALVAVLTAGLLVGATAPASASTPSFKVSIHLAKASIPAGLKLTVSGSVTPSGTGDVTIQRLSLDGTWVGLKKVTLAGSAYTTTVSFLQPGIQVLRVVKPGTHTRKAGNSNIAFLTVADPNWLQISAGKYFGCGVRTNHTLWCWGDNSASLGDLGTGKTASSDVPVQVGSSTNWSSVSAGGQFACAVRTNHTLWCWGQNSSGNLGNGTTGNVALSPVQVGVGTHWKSVSAANSGGAFACAVKTTGTAWCWGDNSFGQLGNGATGAGTGSDVPVRVGTGTSWTKISAGLYFACGLQSDASAWCWGDNRFGQLGDGTTTATDTPGHVGTSAWKSISAGGFFTCGVETDGTAWCWGSNGDGEVGDASTTDRPVPTQVGTDATWSSISAGYFFACGVKTDHTAWCWGYDLYGQLGNGHSGASANTDAPSEISGSGKWASTSAGVDGACGVQTDQTAWCWGRNDNGQLGDGQDGALTDSDTPEFIGARLLHFI